MAQPDPSILANDPLARAFATQSVFVGKSFAGRIDVRRLNALAAHEPKDHPLKIVIADGLPPDGKPFGTPLRYLQALSIQLKLGEGLLLNVTPTGMLAISGELTPMDSQNLMDSAALKAGPDVTENIVRTVKAFDEAARTHVVPAVRHTRGIPMLRESTRPLPEIRRFSHNGPPIFLYFMYPLLALFGVACMVALVVQMVVRGRTVSAVSGPIERMRTEAMSELAAIDRMRTEIPDSPDAQAAWKSYQVAMLLLEESAALTRKHAGAGDYKRAQMLLQQALEQARACRTKLDAITPAVEVAPPASEAGASGR
jgi:hypothetical protein